MASGYAPARGGFSAADGYNNECNGSMGGAPPGMNLGSDFPFVCETCLGPNPYVRMIKMTFGAKECKISARPYQPFRWRAGPGGRHKETIVAYEVARQKNVCQACLVDMAYGLPVAVRDSLLGSAGGDVAPDSRPNADYYWQEKNREFSRALGGDGSLAVEGGMNPSQQLLQLSRALNSRGGANGVGGTAFRNLPKMCSFWLKGVCNRGKSCPFRPCCGIFKFPELASGHPEECQALITQLQADGTTEVMKNLDQNTRQLLMDSQKGSKDQAIRDRYHGTNDKLADKYLARATAMALEPPTDPAVKSLWVGGVDAAISQEDIKDKFYAFGELTNIKVVSAQRCAFVEFAARESAEAAVKELYKNLNIKGHRLQLSWAKPVKKGAIAGAPGANGAHGAGGGYEALSHLPPMPPPPGMKVGSVMPAPPPGLLGQPSAKRARMGGAPPPPPGPPPGPPPAMSNRAPVYASMNSERMGSRHSTT